MEFELCKENIQPLRGGRNRAQLEVALQAQDNEELQKELDHQRQEFETLINTYEGDDPLNNWYSYISWVEQSYPKHGHEGNLFNVLEDCLGKFENDQRYVHDRRMCKLWIKYIDLQQNPDELFQLLHAKGISVSCADLYRAWAFYHEIAGDYKRAHTIYELGMENLAQPMSELEQAQKNMFMAAGRQIVSQEMNDQIQQQIEEQRHALTSLRTYKHKSIVPSKRVGQHILKPTPGTVPLSSSTKSNSKSNKIVTVYSDENKAASSGRSGMIKSILEVARRKEIIKENTLKPGRWTVLKQKKKSTMPHLTPTFKVHEDETPSTSTKYEGIKLYPNFCSTSLDDFSNWKVALSIPDPDDPKKIPMYPKHFVYCQNTEYSLEEIKARKYKRKFSNNQDKTVDIKPENEKFDIFVDESNSNGRINKRDSSNFEIFQDESSCCQTVTKHENEKFSIFCEESVPTQSSSSQKTKREDFSIYCEENVNRKTRSVRKAEKSNDTFSIFDDSSITAQVFPSSSHKDSLSHRSGFSLGKKKTDKKVNEYVCNLIAKLPIQENLPNMIKMDTSHTGEGSSSN